MTRPAGIMFALHKFPQCPSRSTKMLRIQGNELVPRHPILSEQKVALSRIRDISVHNQDAAYNSPPIKDRLSNYTSKFPHINDTWAIFL